MDTIINDFFRDSGYYCCTCIHFFLIFNFFKSAILGVILGAEHEFGIYLIKFSTLGPLGLKFSKIDFAKKHVLWGFRGSRSRI